MNSRTTHFLLSIQAAIREASRSGRWIVAMAPSSAVGDLDRVFPMLLPSNAKLCGRTALFQSGGRLTVASPTESMPGKGFHLLFLGFGEETTLPAETIAAHSWSSAAEDTLVLSQGL